MQESLSPMRLYLIRHGHALSHEDDAKRPLSERGRLTTLSMANTFRANGACTAQQLWHSPLVRAYETAITFARTLDPEISIVETDGLLPLDNPLSTQSRLTNFTPAQDLAIVGHEPHLSSLATLLVRGHPSPNAFHLKKNAVIMLRRTEKVHPGTNQSRWRIGWHFAPELLPLG
jgi:phosphohistidine phosphatase